MKTPLYKHGLRAVLPPNKVHQSRKEELTKRGMDKIIEEELIERQKTDKGDR